LVVDVPFSTGFGGVLAVDVPFSTGFGGVLAAGAPSSIFIGLGTETAKFLG
jgi:hypothetical protein